MLLQKLRMQNIRSYVNEEITFPKGVVLLSGDIGSGKSSILLAIEFALFGSSRTELSADSLLRKGENLGFVELTFSLNGHEIVVYRGLKKELRGIKQTNGYVITNGLKKELTPIEIKAEIVNLLGYPKEFITKKKNHVFRYTVYCPQEAMKLILQESPETRLNTLRKIFGIDKYKTIRDNLLPYLKDMRKIMTVLETRIEPLPLIEEEIQDIQKQIIIVEKNYLEKVSQDKLLQEQITQKQKDLEVLEKQYSLYKNTKFQLKNTQSFLDEINKMKGDLESKEKTWLLEIKQILVTASKEDVKIEKEKLEQEKSTFISIKVKLESEIKHIKSEIESMHKEITQHSVSAKELDDLNESIQKLKSTIGINENIQSLQEEISKKERSLTQEIATHTHIVNTSHGLIKSILSLDECPTCKQHVSGEYKEGIQSNTEDEIMKSKQRLVILKNELRNVEEEKKRLQEKNNHRIETEKRIQLLESSRKEKEFFQKRTSSLKEQLKLKVQKNNKLMKEISQFEEKEAINFSRIEQRIEQLQNLYQKIIRKDDLLKQIESIKLEKKSLDDKKNDSLKKIEEYNTIISQYSLNEEEILKRRTDRDILVLEEKEISKEIASLETNLKFRKEEQNKCNTELINLKNIKIKLIKTKDKYHWINDFFIQLTYTIEKEMLHRIYHHFNDTFKEWFSILVDDSIISSRLNDSFTPVVDQNGHEIDFAYLSGGERTAVSLAYRLALNKVINDVVHTIKTKNLLILDEPTDGFSRDQLDKVRDVLNRLNLEQVLLVSHETKIESFVESVIRVHKNEHVSRVI